MTRCNSPNASPDPRPPPDCPSGVACAGGTCSACKPGYYPSATAASGCAECGFGFYCPNGADRNPCGAGKNTTTTTATDAAQCVPTCTSNTGEGMMTACMSVCMGVCMGVCMSVRMSSMHVCGVCTVVHMRWWWASVVVCAWACASWRVHLRVCGEAVGAWVRGCVGVGVCMHEHAPVRVCMAL